MFILLDKGDFWKNFLVAILERNASFMSFLMRETLDEAQSYTEAVVKLDSTITISTAYYIVGGIHPGQGAVITKGRLRPRDTWFLDPNHGRYMYTVLIFWNVLSICGSLSVCFQPLFCFQSDLVSFPGGFCNNIILAFFFMLPLPPVFDLSFNCQNKVLLFPMMLLLGFFLTMFF